VEDAEQADAKRLAAVAGLMGTAAEDSSLSSAAVIGAGFAGMAAAAELSAAGVAVTVLEREQRVGGRVWSQTLPGGAIVEMGAEFVTEGYAVLPALVSRLGLELAPMGMSFTRRDPRGGIGVDAAALDAALAALAGAVEAGTGEGFTVAELLEQVPMDAGARELIACRIQVSYAHPVSLLAADAVREVGELFDDVEARRVAGGNQRVAERLGAGLRVDLGTAAMRVAQVGDGFRVNDDLEVDAVVVAVPAPATDGIAFDPPLPAWKADALARVVYGHAAKLAVPLLAGARASSVLSVPEHFWTWTAKDGNGAVAPLVTAFAGSQPAVEALQVDEGPERYLERVAALRPDLELDVAAAVLSTWPDGAYSARQPDRPADLDDRLEATVGRIAFAGEHTERHWYATMEGALRSGERAARQLLGGC
jgi:monoamine oxidase